MSVRGEVEAELPSTHTTAEQHRDGDAGLVSSGKTGNAAGSVLEIRSQDGTGLAHRPSHDPALTATAQPPREPARQDDRSELRRRSQFPAVGCSGLLS